nr:VCBS repeat-containing protein [candidate division Zixibacteria bacterium]
MNVRLITAVILLWSFMASAGVFAQVPLESTPFWQTSEEDMYSTGMIWRDCNNDGCIDGFFSNGNDIVMAPNYVYLSKYGTMPSVASWYSANNDYSGHCAVGDVDDNGYPDLAVSNFIGHGGFSTAVESDLYLNFNGRLNTTPDWHTDDTMFTFSCAFGDPDGDGDLDLAVVNGQGYGGPQEYDGIYFNIDGVLQTTPGWVSADPTEGMDVTWGDVDNDGDLDLAFCYDDRPAQVFYNNGGAIETTPSWSSWVDESANTLIFGDVNGDGWLDLVVAYNYQNSGHGYYRVHFNDGTGTLQNFPAWQSADGGYGSAVSMYDYDNDGDDDLAAGRWWDRPRVYENTGTEFSYEPVWRADGSTVVEEMAWIDIDGDGVEQRADTFYVMDGRRLLYTLHHPLQAIDSVAIDGVTIDIDAYCFDLISGWVSLGQEPYDSVAIYYQYSFKNDLTVSNWDTFNMAFGNTSRPYLDFYADTSYGPVPLAVQFSDSSIGSSDWQWHFDDGDSATEPNPFHVYQNGGVFDVRLDAVLPDGPHNRTRKMMIITFADTLYFPNVIFSGDTVKIPLYLKNCHPLYAFTIPLVYSGSLDLGYFGYDTDSCVTDYFDLVNRTASDPTGKKLAFNFTASLSGTKPPLAPGYGRILNFYFLRQSGSGTNILDTTTISAKYLNLNADYINYQPVVQTGYITNNYVIKGDADGSGAINILDVTFLIRYLYLGGQAPDFYAGDANSDGSINILDVTYLINYLYKDGPPPAPIYQGW